MNVVLGHKRKHDMTNMAAHQKHKDMAICVQPFQIYVLGCHLYSEKTKTKNES